MWQQFIMMLLMVILVSCGNQDYTDIEENQGGEPVMKLRISTLAAQSTAAQGVVEKIKSLRVVMLSDGFVEYNAKFDYTTDEGAKAASTFTHVLERATVAGNKSFYLFANEESVKSVNFDGITELPEWITQDLSLGDFLNHYTRDKLPAQGTLGYTNSGSGSEFEQLVNSLYFSPDYTITDNTVYLPYTSYYTGYQATNDPDLTLEVSMFLVPVATKFTFNFKNYRQEKVQLYEIRLAKVNKHNFVMANLADSEKEKTYNEKKYYWIDWLKEVSAGSQLAGGSSSYNDKAGWIENYFMPALANQSAEEDLLEKSITPDLTEDWLLPALTNMETPPTLKVVEYFPESFCLGKKSVYNSSTGEFEEVDAQIYKVAFKVNEIREGNIQAPVHESEPTPLDMVKALFRNTHVVVNIDMYESVVQIYCEIEEWGYNSTPFLGFVQEDDED